MQITATIFEIGGGAAHDGDESLQEVGDGVAVPETATATPMQRTWCRVGAPDAS